jgi:aspartate racemase
LPLLLRAMAQHVGIVGCSAEGAALCYRTFCVEAAALMGPHAHPEVSLHTHPLSEYMECIHRDDWQGVAGLMLSSAEKLGRIGADFLISPDNTIHRAFHLVAPRSPLPWLHIVEEVAKDAKTQGFRRLAITGTRYTMEGPVYPEKLNEAGVEYRFPDAGERQEIDRIIMDELVYGKFTPASLRYFQQVIQRLKGQGCDAVVLGCTEIPLLVSPEDSPLPTLDSTRLLARAAIHRAVGVEAAVANR